MPSSRVEDLPRLPQDADGPVFAEPWQAQAFALTIRLHEADCFSWGEWTAALAAELRWAAERGEPDNDAAHYYEHWVAALEGLLTAKGLTDADRSIAANMPGLRRIVGRHTASRSNWRADPAVQTIANMSSSLACAGGCG